jgi:hypothetical protein
MLLRTTSADAFFFFLLLLLLSLRITSSTVQVDEKIWRSLSVL